MSDGSVLRGQTVSSLDAAWGQIGPAGSFLTGAGLELRRFVEAVVVHPDDLNTDWPTTWASIAPSANEPVISGWTR